jgi:hypothetical protein
MTKSQQNDNYSDTPPSPHCFADVYQRKGFARADMRMYMKLNGL